MFTDVKVILPARIIPLGSTVTKRTGTKEYVLRDRITVYDNGDSKQEIIASDGAVYLSSEGCANAIASETNLVWHTDINSLVRLSEGPHQ